MGERRERIEFVRVGEEEEESRRAWEWNGGVKFNSISFIFFYI